MIEIFEFKKSMCYSFDTFEHSNFINVFAILLLNRNAAELNNTNIRKMLSPEHFQYGLH